MFEEMIVKEVKSLLLERVLTSEKIAKVKADIIQKIADEKLVENTVDSLVDIAVASVMSFLPPVEK